MEDKICLNCKFWLRNKQNTKYPEAANFGDCRRHSPRLIVASCGVGESPEWSNDWTQTGKNEWCGEFEIK